jgi:hypothetical protein
VINERGCRRGVQAEAGFAATLAAHTASSGEIRSGRARALMLMLMLKL